MKHILVILFVLGLAREMHAQQQPQQPPNKKCFGVDFFKGKLDKPAPRYFKIYYKKPTTGTEVPDVKYALAPGRNYRITPQVALKTDEKWSNGCPVLTPEQQAVEQKSGGVVAKVIVGGAVLADDVKGGAIKGFNETSNFFANTAPQALKEAGEKIKAGFEAAGEGIKDVAGKAGEWFKGAGETVKGGFEDFGHTVKGWF